MKDRAVEETRPEAAPEASAKDAQDAEIPDSQTARPPSADSGQERQRVQERIFAPRGNSKPHFPPPQPGEADTDWAKLIREFHVSGQGPEMPDDPPPSEPLWPAALETLEADGEANYTFPYLLPRPSPDEDARPRPLEEVVDEALEACRKEGTDTTLLETHLDKLLHLADAVLSTASWREGRQGSSSSAGNEKNESPPGEERTLSQLPNQRSQAPQSANDGKAARSSEAAAAPAFSVAPSAPVAAVLDVVFERFEESFADSSEAARRELHGQVDALRRRLPREGALLAFHPLAPLVLYAWSLARGRRQAALDFTGEVRRLAAELEGRLESDAQLKGQDAQGMSQSIGEQGEALVDTAALSSLLPGKRGSKPLEPHRRERMQKALDTLKVHLQASLNEPPLHILHRGPQPALPGLEAEAFHSHEEPLQAAIDFFDRVMERRLRVLRALRIAALETEGRYRPELHDAVFERFQWQSCSEDELRALPPVVVLESAQRLSGRAMSDLSRVLGSSRPIQVLALNDDPLTRLAGGGLDLSTGYLPDLGYLAMAHREAFVLQGTLVRPRHLLDGLDKMTQTLDPSLALVWVPEGADTSNSANRTSNFSPPPHRWTWMLGWSAHAGRAAACFTYSPAAGLTWAERFDLQGNPQPESLCPTYRLNIADADGQEQELGTALTFAHAAALNPNYRAHFHVIPRQAWDADGDGSTGRPTQMEVSRYIDEFDQTPPAAIPFLWVVDEDNTLQRAVLTREMAAACRDRKRSWRMLQELAGVNNEYVRRAEEKLRRQLEEGMQSEQDELLEKARKQGAEEAIDRLVGILTGVELVPAGDLAAPVLTGEGASQETPPRKADQGSRSEAARDSSSQSKPTGEAPNLQQDVPGGEAAEPSGGPAGEAVTPGGGPAGVAEEPYIDTILCTSCNDCIQLNPLLFKYNSDKQAEIADASAGTFAQLVQAAESCPAHCIHPGSPPPGDPTATPEMAARAQALES